MFNSLTQTRSGNRADSANSTNYSDKISAPGSRSSRYLFTALIGSLLLFFLATVAYGQDNLPQEIDPENLLPQLSRPRALDVRTPDVFEGEGELRWFWEYEHPSSTNFLRLRICVEQFSSINNWSIRILDGDRNLVETLPAEAFQQQPPSARWTKQIRGRRVRVELRASVKPENLRILIDRLNFSFFRPGERVFTTGSNDMRDITQVQPRYYQYGRPTAIIFLQRATNQNETNCTGFLLTPNLMITNRHCISQEWQLQTATAEFGYETNGLTRETRSFSRLEAQNQALDFAILRLANPINSWSFVRWTTEPIENNQALVLIQYPSARLKTISIKDCKVMSKTVTDRPNRPDDFYHLCDTEGGSSGAALMDEVSGRVVGLHYLGVYRTKKQGRNLAVKFSAILEKLRSGPTTRHLYDEIVAQSASN